MIHFLRPRSSKITEGGNFDGANDVVLTFTPRRIVLAICFHLLEDKHVETMNAKSCQKIIDELAQRMATVAIVKSKWASMDNSQRLEWLLNQSRIQTQISDDGTAELSLH